MMLGIPLLQMANSSKGGDAKSQIYGMRTMVAGLSKGKILLGGNGGMEKESKFEKLDREWVELMKVAKQSGLTKNEVRAYFQQLSFKPIEPKA